MENTSNFSLNGLDKFYDWAEKNNLDTSKAQHLCSESIQVLTSDAEKRIDILFSDNNPNWEKIKNSIKGVTLSSSYKNEREIGAVDILETTSHLIRIFSNHYKYSSQDEIIFHINELRIWQHVKEGRKNLGEFIWLLSQNIINNIFNISRNIALKIDEKGIATIS